MQKVCLILFIAAMNVFALNLPVDGLYNETIDELRVRGVFLNKYPGVKPYYIGKFTLKDKDIRSTELDSWLLSRVKRATPFIETNWIYDTTNTAKVKVNILYEDDNFALFLQPILKVGKDSLHPRKLFKDIVAADYERAYVTLTPGNFQLLVGRERFSIGPSPYDNLILSGKGIPLDLIMGSYESNFFKLSMLFSRLDDIYDKVVDFVGDTSECKENQFRYITIKRLDLSLKDILQRFGIEFLDFVNAINFGLSDACVFGGENVLPDLFYLNPLMIGYFHQWTRGDDSNTLLCLDSRVDLNNFSFYVQWLIDDYQYSEDKNAEPNHTGWNLGIQLADPFGLKRAFFTAEYTRVSRWTYTYFRPAARYNYNGLTLGHPDGPDFDKFSLAGLYHIDRNFDISYGFNYRRKGETVIETLWPIPEMPRVPGTYFPENNFLSGVIEKSLCCFLGFGYYNLPKISIHLLTSYTRINNYRNINRKKKNYFGINIDISLRI